MAFAIALAPSLRHRAALWVVLCAVSKRRGAGARLRVMLRRVQASERVFPGDVRTSLEQLGLLPGPADGNESPAGCTECTLGGSECDGALPSTDTRQPPVLGLGPPRPHLHRL